MFKICWEISGWKTVEVWRWLGAMSWELGLPGNGSGDGGGTPTEPASLQLFAIVFFFCNTHTHTHAHKNYFLYKMLYEILSPSCYLDKKREGNSYVSRLKTGKISMPPLVETGCRETQKTGLRGNEFRVKMQF